MGKTDFDLQRFVDRFSQFFEGYGASRSGGQVLAWLLISEEPQTLDDIAEGLDISKASASLGTRMWEQINLIERIHLRGDRKVYYQVSPNLSVTLASAALEKLGAIANMAEEGLATLGDDRPNAKAKLREFARVYRYLYEQTPKLFAGLKQNLKEE